MCPLYPLHLILTYSIILCLSWLIAGQSVVNAIEAKIGKQIRLIKNKTVLVDNIDITEKQTEEYKFYIEHASLEEKLQNIIIKEESNDGLQHIDISPGKVTLEKIDYPLENEKSGSYFGASFNITGSFLGFSKVKLYTSDGDDNELMELTPIDVKVHRGKRPMDAIFIHVVIILVIIAYINMGCALEMPIVKQTMRRPVGPIIGLLSQYLIMPVMAFVIGYLLFPTTPELWLSLFITGCAPGGGGSNMWTYLLNGNLNLSVTMTFVSTVAAFGMIPLWVFALGRVIFAGGEFSHLPYRNIAMLVLGLVVPCGIGVLIRRCSPRSADFLKRMLKPVSIFFLVFVMSFGIYANLYMFSFFSWRVVLGGFLLPLFGYLFGGLAAFLFRQEWPDITAISIETGIQNTGLAIGILKVALRDYSPLDDIGIIMPVAVATMTPIPLSIVYALQCFYRRTYKKAPFQVPIDDSSTQIYQGDKYDNSI